jgi:hypothetical protein
MIMNLSKYYRFTTNRYRLTKFIEIVSIWLILIVSMFGITTCRLANGDMVFESTVDPRLQDNTATIHPLINSTIAFPVGKEIEGERHVMEAIVIGDLIIEDNCIRVISDTGRNKYLLIWPPGFSLNTETDPVQILDETGKVVARIGDYVRIGGGEIKLKISLGEYTSSQIPSQCPGPYWIVGESVGLANP